MNAKTLLAILCTATLSAQSPQSNTYERMAQEMLKNFTAINNAEKALTKEKNRLFFKIPEVSEYEKHSGLLSVLSAAEQEACPDDAQIDVLNPTSTVDLNLYFYNQEHPEFTLLNTLYRGHTTMGKIALARQISKPTTNIAKLHKQQELTKWLLAHPHEAAELSQLFADFKEHESLFLSLWNKHDLLYTQNVKKTFYGGSFKKWQTKRGALKLELKRRFQDLMIPGTPLLLFLFSYFCISKIAAFSTRLQAERLKLKYTEPPSLWHQITNPKEFQFTTGFSMLWSGINSYFLLQILWAKVKNRMGIVEHLRERFKSLIHFNNLVHRTHAFISKHPELAELLPTYGALDDFVRNPNTKHQTFLKNIESHAFTSSSYLFANIGSVLQALPQFLAIRNSFAPLMNAVGSVDANIGLAKLYSEYQDTRVGFSFVEYEQSDTPHMTLTDFWHPMIDPSKVVTNSISMGTPGSKDAILTGPNASGKSTILKAMVVSVLLAQSIGMAPVKEAKLTPYSRITTYLNIIDDLGEGQSLFKAEVARAQELVTIAEKLDPGQFCLTVMDEIFSGTAPREGEAAAYGVAHALAQSPACMSIIATHFPKLTTLPRVTDGIYKNYKVYVQRTGDGGFIHPFKLEPGRSHQVIALDLMHQEGFDQAILDHAYQFLHDHPTAGVDEARNPNHYK